MSMYGPINAVWIDPYSNYGNGYWGELGPQRLGPIPPQRELRLPEITDEQRQALLDAFARMQNVPAPIIPIITTDRSAAPTPVEAAPVTPEPQGVDTSDSFKPGRKLDID